MLNSIWSSTPTVPLKNIADAILQLSDFYIKNPQQATPWSENYCQLAYRYYFLPLNIIRASGVIQRGKQVGFFSDLTHFIDWGAGPGTASLALVNQLRQKIQSQILIDHSKEVFKVFSDVHKTLSNPEISTKNNLSDYLQNKNSTALIFSYSITEIKDLPKDWDQFEALMILEPATSEDGRKLLKLRDQLIQKEYHIYAPCVHQLSCPLLSESKHDWCHDRFSVKAPEWFKKLETLLPMKNQTVTTSYLLARKKPASNQLQNRARLTGDQLKEKGKTRQMVCQGPKREFLTWMHKSTTPQELFRGDLIQLPNDIEKKSNELRVQSQPAITIEDNL